MKRKNWSLFLWAFRHMELDHKNKDVIYKRGLKNILLCKLMDLSGVTPKDMPEVLHKIEDELKRRGEL